MTGRTHPVPRGSRRSAAPHPGTPYAGRRARNTAPTHPPERPERGVLGRISRVRISRGRLSTPARHRLHYRGAGWYTPFRGETHPEQG